MFRNEIKNASPGLEAFLYNTATVRRSENTKHEGYTYTVMFWRIRERKSERCLPFNDYLIKNGNVAL